MSVAFVGLGANVGDPRAQLMAATSALEAIPRTRVTARSSLYLSAPVGHTAQPDFINAVVRIETGLAPADLLAELRSIEDRLGRQRLFANAPRTLDLDLLLYADERIDTPSLTVPHPRMHERAFVLAPLLEIDPSATIPGRGRAAACFEACGGQRAERLDA